MVGVFTVSSAAIGSTYTRGTRYTYVGRVLHTMTKFTAIVWIIYEDY